jgi:transposase
MKREVVVETGGIPLGVVTDAANIGETVLGEVVLTHVRDDVSIPADVPVLADRAYDSDPLRIELKSHGFILISPHRSNRTAPPTNDGRRMRRYKRRYGVERTFAWMHSYRRVMRRYERKVDLFDCFVSMACAFICLNRAL